MGMMTDPMPAAMPGPMAQGMNEMPGKRRGWPVKGAAKPVAVTLAMPKPGQPPR